MMCLSRWFFPFVALFAACHGGAVTPQNGGAEPVVVDENTKTDELAPTPLSTGSAASTLGPLGCDLSGPAVGAPGSRKLALLVGVGDYKSDLIPDLQGPPKDVEAMARLLTDPTLGYAFPPENVCVLRGEQATRAGVEDAFKRALIDRAQPGDVAVFYFSGHGTQIADQSRDEPDEKDEALLMYDSWTPGVETLRDDDLGQLLARLHRATDHVVLLLDACTSGGASRSVGARARQVIRDDLPVSAPITPGGDGEGIASDSLPGLVMLSAARDGSLALEPPDGGLGYFTAALIETLLESPGQATWAQVGRKIPARLEQLSDHQQFPLAQGALDRVVFGAGRPDRPLGWEIVQVGETITLEGVALPGWGQGAELRVVSGSASATDARDPAKAKATLVVERYDGVTAQATLLGKATSAIEPGDLAVLSAPAPSSWRLEVSIDSSVSTSTRDGLIKALQSDAEASAMVVVRPSAPYVLSEADGALRLRGPEGVTRNLFTKDKRALPAQVRKTLVQHARQQVLLSVRGAGGGLFRDGETLEVRIVLRGEQPGCARPGWVQACPGERQQIPLCNTWGVEVRNTHPTETLRVGGAILSSDGAILTMPRDGQAMELPAGAGWVPIDGSRTFAAVPPFGVVEDIVVFGTTRDVNLNWSLLSASDPTGKDVSGSVLGAQLARWMTGGFRAVVEVKSAPSTWTVSSMPFQVVANTLPDPAALTCPGQATGKEYTIQSFDIKPYLPSDPTTALYRVLEQAEKLTTMRETDGVPYRQHDWSRPNDAANLSYGIDCSRAIWFAFTRAGVPYTSSAWHNGFVSTAQMFDESIGSCRSELTPDSTLMKENFESCLGQPFETGDVLVWQGIRPTNKECIGHTVMVIDPEAFIGWGSHGWDGSKSAEGVKLNDSGVEYQKILNKSWANWDRKQYELKACWRHKQFIAEANRADPNEDLYLTSFSCDDASCRP